MIASTNCHHCQQPQCEWTTVRCTHGMYCREAFCFSCLSKIYPSMYNNVFSRICWTCPACLGTCKCGICSDPEKKQERERVAHEQCLQEKALLAAQQAVYNSVASSAYCPPQKEQPQEVAANSWCCPRCSVVNNAEELECSACLFHKKRSRKRTNFSEPTDYEDKHHVQKETKRAREVYDERSPPVKGRVSALRQLVKKPWMDGWDLARKLALDLVEEAKQQAIKQGMPVSQVRQLPTKYQLANNRGTHVRKWFDREPTLAKKFLRAAGLICSKSNGTFIKEDIPTLDDMPPLIRKADLSKYDEGSPLSDDDQGVMGAKSTIEASPTSSPGSESPSPDYESKLKVYYHRPNETEPFVFKVPINDLKSVDELQTRLAALLKEMGQIPDVGTSSVSEKQLLLTNTDSTAYSAVEDIAKCPSIHVRALPSSE